MNRQSKYYQLYPKTGRRNPILPMESARKEGAPSKGKTGVAESRRAAVRVYGHHTAHSPATAASAMSDKARYPVLAGWIAGSLEIVATYPIEYVKTQLQLQARITG